MSTRSAALMTVLVAALVPPAAAAQDAAQTVTLSADSHVRAVGRDARWLLERAVASSPTVARIVGSLQSSDLIVNVELCPLSKKTRGEFRVVTATPTVRYARIRIGVPNSPDELMAVLGHELQHAMEVAAAPEIRDTITQRKYYERIGWAAMEDGYFETEAAVETGRRVAAELREMRRSAARAVAQ